METLKSLLQTTSISSTMQPTRLVTGEEIFLLQVAAPESARLWQVLREHSPHLSYWPVVLGTDEHVAAHLRTFASPDIEPTKAILTAADNIHLDNWFSERLYEIGFASQTVDPDPDRRTIDDLRGPWPEDITPAMRESFSWPSRYRAAQAVQTITIALLPTSLSWQAPAWLKFGDWNNCPSSDVQVRLLRYWHEQYGVEVVGIGKDTVELRVGQPLTHPEIALQVAYEQFVYCPDLIDREIKTIDMLAALLLNEQTWLFWWD